MRDDNGRIYRHVCATRSKVIILASKRRMFKRERSGEEPVYP